MRWTVLQTFAEEISKVIFYSITDHRWRQPVSLLFKDGREWKFKHGRFGLEPDGFYRKTGSNLYRIHFTNGHEPDVWVGRYYRGEDSGFWLPSERDLRAVAVRFGRGIYFFDFVNKRK